MEQRDGWRSGSDQRKIPNPEKCFNLREEEGSVRRKSLPAAKGRGQVEHPEESLQHAPHERNSYRTGMDITWLTDRIAVGGGIWNAENMAKVARAGITHIIDMQIEFDDTPLAVGARNRGAVESDRR